MLVKSPEGRIGLEEVTRHPWFTASPGLPGLLALGQRVNPGAAKQSEAEIVAVVREAQVRRRGAWSAALPTARCSLAGREGGLPGLRGRPAGQDSRARGPREGAARATESRSAQLSSPPDARPAAPAGAPAPD